MNPLEHLPRAPLAIAPRYLGHMLAVLEGRQVAQAPRTLAFMGQPLRGTTVAGSIAIIPMLGPIMHRAGAFSAFGAVGIDALRASVRWALDEPGVEGILLAIDSPGGEVAGVADLADELYAARGKKPMRAVADEGMYSAAYWLGAAAGPITVTRTGGVGSIGALIAHTDVTGALEKMGVKVTVVKSGAKKAMYSPFAPLTEAARDGLQAEVDRVAGLFIDAVARYRGLTAAAVRGFEAGTFEGEAAKDAGLADDVGTLETAFAALESDVRRAHEPAPTGRKGAGTMSDDVKAPAAAADDVQAEARAEVKAQIFDLNKARAAAAEEARAKAAAAERKRAAEIIRWCEFACKPDMAEAYIDSSKSVEEVRNELAEATVHTGPAIDGVRSETIRRPELSVDEIYARRREAVRAAQQPRRI